MFIHRYLPEYRTGLYQSTSPNFIHFPNPLHAYSCVLPHLTDSKLGSHLVVDCMDSSLHLLGLVKCLAVSFLLSSCSASASSDLTVPEPPTAAAAGGRRTPLLFPPVLLCAVASSAKGTFSALLCKLRPSAAPLLDGPFCASSLTGRDLKRACDSLKRLLVVAVDV